MTSVEHSNTPKTSIRQPNTTHKVLLNTQGKPIELHRLQKKKLEALRIKDHAQGDTPQAFTKPDKCSPAHVEVLSKEEVRVLKTHKRELDKVLRNTAEAKAVKAEYMKDRHIVHDEKGKFVSGSGRPAGALSLTTKLRNALTIVGEGEVDTDAMVIVNKVVEMAKAGDKSMIQMMWNYVDGKPVQRLELTQGDDSAKLSDEQKEKLDGMFSDAEVVQKHVGDGGV